MIAFFYYFHSTSYYSNNNSIGPINQYLSCVSHCSPKQFRAWYTVKRDDGRQESCHAKFIVIIVSFLRPNQATNLELTTRLDHDLGACGPRLRSNTFNGLDDIHAVNNLSKDDMLKNDEKSKSKHKNLTSEQSARAKKSRKEDMNIQDAPFHRASWSRRCKERTDFRWCWVQRWPYSRFQGWKHKKYQKYCV